MKKFILLLSLNFLLFYLSTHSKVLEYYKYWKQLNNYTDIIQSVLFELVIPERTSYYDFIE